jgi:hypothetical protein
MQIVYSSHRGSRDIEHIGSVHDEVELELLKAAARQRLAAGQDELDLGLEATGPAYLCALRSCSPAKRARWVSSMSASVVVPSS